MGSGHAELTERRACNSGAGNLAGDNISLEPLRSFHFFDTTMLTSMTAGLSAGHFNADAEVSRLLALCDQGGLEHAIPVSLTNAHPEPSYQSVADALSVLQKQLLESTLLLEEAAGNLTLDIRSGVTAAPDPLSEAASVHRALEQCGSYATDHRIGEPPSNSEDRQSTAEHGPYPPASSSSRDAGAQGSAEVPAALAGFQQQQAAYTAEQAAAAQRRALLAAQVLAMLLAARCAPLRRHVCMGH